MKKTSLSLWELHHTIEFHWKDNKGNPFYSGPFDPEFPELVAAYFELRWIRGDRENSHLVPRSYDGKKDRKAWNQIKNSLNLSTSFEDIKRRFE